MPEWTSLNVRPYVEAVTAGVADYEELRHAFYEKIHGLSIRTQRLEAELAAALKALDAKGGGNGT